ncbi:MAG TPA: HAD family hydrolase [Solirubrobacteraceae bacterium]|jgi:HAD superfamily hydrolase (TIGR01509 family)|nr:HAD family hydrolase [Solirubrobacteraceae bacterium]
MNELSCTPVAVRLAVLDIGSTLVEGPSRGPASRIAEAAGLDDDQRSRLRRALMCEPFTQAEDVISFAATHGLDGQGRSPGRLTKPGRPDRFADAVRKVWSLQEQEADALPGAAEALYAMHAAGLHLALASNIWQPYLTAVRRTFGDTIDALVAPELQLFSFREGRAKPDPSMFERALSRAGVSPEEAVMVGDSYAEDIAPAQTLGMRTVWVLRRPQREAPAVQRVQRGERRAPTLTVASIAGAAGLLRAPQARAA